MRTMVYINSALNDEQKASLDSVVEQKVIRDIRVFYEGVAATEGLRDISIDSQDDFLDGLADVDELICFSSECPMLDEKILASLFSNGAKIVHWVGHDGVARPFSVSDAKISILFVFPGPIVPLSLGSHQRAFNLLFNLSRQGFGIDVLIPTNKNIDEYKVRLSLGTVCSNVYFYKDRRKKFQPHVLLKRGIEKRVRLLLGKDGRLQDLFSERAYYKPTESAKRWLNSLYIAKEYSTIIVSYAWMLDVIKYVAHMKERFSLVCDTHDVQFVRNEALLNRKERLFFSNKSEKRNEVSRLEKADVVLAISASDAKVLKKTLSGPVVVTASAGFDYQLKRIKKRPMGRPIHFGFIGGAMEANALALLYAIEKWWPTIKQHSPDSILYVAGSVAKDSRIQHQVFMNENIVDLGFVKKLDDFYNKIEVSLNPVMVQGGLNFKSVEAVFAGKHLFTNRLGFECLGAGFECIVIDDSNDIVEFMNSVEFNLEFDYEKRLSSQKAAHRLFCNENVSKDLIRTLSFANN